MDKKKIGLFWLKDDFRLNRNLGLCQATKNHDQVCVFYLFKKQNFENQEAQKWWVCKSLEEFKKKLAKYNFSKIFDLQNSSRTKFYKKFIFCDLLLVSCIFKKFY